MDQHPIPRQITTFEFKLIGFMTLKQFLYLVVFAPLGIIIYFLVPIPIINVVLGVIIGSIGLAFAFVPINDRPLDVWIKNLYRRLTSATQYTYQKQNKPCPIFNELYFVADPHRVMAHIESQKKLTAYLSKTNQLRLANKKRQVVGQLTQQPSGSLRVEAPVTKKNQTATAVFNLPSTEEKKPFFIGVVRNNKKIPLPGVLIYVKDLQGNPVRLLKTNPHGVFATYSNLQGGEYVFEMKDPKKTYFFDTMKVRIEGARFKPLEFCSREML